MKYVNHEHFGLILFSDVVTHAAMAFALMPHGECESAGFVDATARECHGESVSLGLESRQSDTELLRMVMR